MKRALMIFALWAIAVAGCASPAPRASGPVEGDAQPSPAINRTLIMVARGEPASLAQKPLRSSGGVGAINPLFNATLAYSDERGLKHPYQAEALPQLNTPSWQIFPDGRMQTTYRLKPNLTWHDGASLTASDFVFAWQVYATPELGAAASLPLSLIESVSAPDAQSIVISWRRPYPDAGDLTSGLPALPRHILEETHSRADHEATVNHPYWSNQYIGSGPYRLTRWEPGALIEATGFAGHVLGAPKINRVNAMFTTNANAGVAGLLSGDHHVVFDYVLMYEHGAAVEKEWAARGMQGTVLYSPVLYRMTQVQFRPDFAPRALLDTRVRQAVAHAFDKQGINEALIGGKALITPSMTSPRAEYAPLVDQALTKYPFDVRRTQQLLEQAGLVRGADGFYAGPGGEPFKPDVWYIENPTQASENAIIVDTLRRAGVDAFTQVLPVGLVSDGQARSSFAALSTTGGGGFEGGFGSYVGSAISRPESRWQGGNRGAWVNPEFDRLWDAYNTTLNPTERVQQIVQMERIISADVGFIPHYFTPVVTAHVANLKGPIARTDQGGPEILYVHSWEWVS